MRGLLFERARQSCIGYRHRPRLGRPAAFRHDPGLVNIWSLGNYSFDLFDKFDALWVIYKKAIMSRKPSGPAYP